MKLRSDFISTLGFCEDPFAHTNADEESRLSDYFVPPPYFAEAFGDPGNPKPFFVFAPRGGGKSAQRIMMENQCLKHKVLCLSYTDFEHFAVESPDKITLSDHIERILRIGWTGILVTLENEPRRLRGIAQDRKSLAETRILHHVGALSEYEFRSALDSLKSHTRKVKAFIERNSLVNYAAGTFLRTLLQKVFRAELLPLMDANPRPIDFELDPAHELRVMREFAESIGYDSIYVLVDRVDESSMTNADAMAAFRLIEPMVRSLSFLESAGYGFKFFLWDVLQPKFVEHGRADRVKNRKLEWNRRMLLSMLRKRLQAHSEDRIVTLHDIAVNVRPYNVDELAVLFAVNSPRDMIRFCDKIVAEQQQLGGDNRFLTTEAIYRGIDAFSEMRVQELYDASYVKQFRQIGARDNQVDFTISYLTHEVFRNTDNANRARIKTWRDRGYIVDLGRVENKSKKEGRSVKLYGMSDIRLAREMTKTISAEQFLKEKVRMCPLCNSPVVRDWKDSDSLGVCLSCGHDSTPRQNSSEQEEDITIDNANGGDPQQQELL